MTRVETLIGIVNTYEKGVWTMNWTIGLTICISLLQLTSLCSGDTETHLGVFDQLILDACVLFYGSVLYTPHRPFFPMQKYTVTWALMVTPYQVWFSIAVAVAILAY
jgi:hypothetical protein